MVVLMFGVWHRGLAIGIGLRLSLYIELGPMLIKAFYI